MHFADIWEAIAGAIPEADAIVQGERTLDWRTYEQRAAKLAGGLHAAGISRGAKVGLYLFNCPEYLEAQFASFKLGACPINVNYRYVDHELVYLLENADAEAVVFHASLGDRLRRVRDRLPKVKAFICVDDEQTAEPVPDELRYEDLISDHEPSRGGERRSDDVYMLYTGGTTGMPKGVMYRIGDVAGAFLSQTSALYGLEVATTPQQAVAGALALTVQGDLRTTLVGPPLMHGAGMWIGALAPHLLGRRVALLEGRSLDADEVLDTISRREVNTLVIVGDSFARPILDAAEGRPDVDLSSLSLLVSSGAMLSAPSKDRFLAVAPQVTILDLLGSSEGSMGMTVAAKGLPSSTAKFRLNPGVRVVREDLTDVEAGTDETGIVLLTSAMVPVGYYKDPEKSAQTFLEIDGTRYSAPGDVARVEVDGSITLLGRGSACINTGGEKVFVEEVEEAIKTHPAVADCLVFGVDDETFGQRVVAVLSRNGDDRLDLADVQAHVRTLLAGYKTPRNLLEVDLVPRAPNGKADYRAARDAYERCETTSME